MLQKFKILQMEYFASNQITETAAEIVKFPSRLRNFTGNRILLYYFCEIPLTGLNDYTLWVPCYKIE